jgi:hypothetical protein
MITGTLKLPTLRTRTVWAGMYGGHYTGIVFFSKKPKLSNETTTMTQERYYCVNENIELTVGSMWLPDFEELFPDADIEQYRPTSTEITKVFKIKLTAVWEDGLMKETTFRADGYGYGC